MKKSILITLLVLSPIYFGLAQNITWGTNSSFTLHEQTLFPAENYIYSNIEGDSQITSLDRLLSSTTSGYVKVYDISKFITSHSGITLENPPNDLNLYITLTPVATSEIAFESDRFTLVVRPQKKIAGITLGGDKFQLVAQRGTSLFMNTIESISNLSLTDIVNAEVIIEKVGSSTFQFKYNGVVFATTIAADTNTDYNLSFTTSAGQYFGFKYEVQGFDFSSQYYPCLTGLEDSDKNWISNCAFDIKGHLRKSQISFADELGRTIQVQGLDLKTDKRWISEVQYDAEGRPAFATSSSPATLSSIHYTYMSDFTRKMDGSTYSNSDWEGIIPQPTGSQPESLGWYYSTNNTSEPFQDITSYPFMKKTYSTLNPGNILKVEGGRQLDNNLPQSFSYTVPAAQELYYVFGKDAFQGETTTNGKEVVLKAFKTVNVNEKGVENVVFHDAEGKLLAMAGSGGATNYEVVALVGKQGYVDVHIPQNITASQITFENSSASDFKIFNLRTEEVATSMAGGNFYRLELLNASSENKAYITSSGTIVADANAKGIRYPVNYFDYTLNYYNEVGMLIKGTDPNGFNAACLSHIQNNPIHIESSSFVYNSEQLTTYSDTDRGVTNVKHRKDGQIRFSQNSKQALVNEFSYTNYDDLGRSTENGVAVGNFSTLNPDIANFTATDFKEQHFTEYDEVVATELSGFHEDYQTPTFLAGSISKTQNDHTTTYYSYDIYGRLEWLVQNIPGLGLKTIDYEYDPITSKVMKVIYQKYNASELYIHRYTYDSLDSNLVKVETSNDDVNYTEHAAYHYYETGELKNVQLVEGIQQIDYVYTLSGQLKSINHPGLNPSDDPGGNSNDMFGMTIDYFANDYQRNSAFPSVTGGTDQHNGNIKGVTWNVDQDAGENPVQYTYEYNRENWLTEANFNGGGSTAVPGDIIVDTSADPNQTITASNSITFLPNAHVVATSGTAFNAIINSTGVGYGTTDYQVSNISYDANGNIQTLKRNKNTEDGSNNMDDLDYLYYLNKPNQLRQVTDEITMETNANDIKTQTNLYNYVYNDIGQLVQNLGEDIAYTYNASSLVTEVKELSTGNPIIKLYYNDKNHRVKKESFNDGVLQSTTFYVRDVTGNVVSIYTNGVLEEHPIYGKGRLGIHYRQSNSYSYQLTDHLGNVRAVIVKSGTDAVALTAKTDYYPFGMPMPNREVNNGYRYAYQGQEKDVETDKEAFELRLWDHRIGRWLSVDPKAEFHSPYMGMGNNPISTVDPDGGCGICSECPDSCLHFKVTKIPEGHSMDLVSGEITKNTFANPHIYLADVYISSGEELTYGEWKYFRQHNYRKIARWKKWSNHEIGMQEFYKAREEMSRGVLGIIGAAVAPLVIVEAAPFLIAAGKASVPIMKAGVSVSTQGWGYKAGLDVIEQTTSILLDDSKTFGEDFDLLSPFIAAYTGGGKKYMNELFGATVGASFNDGLYFKDDPIYNFVDTKLKGAIHSKIDNWIPSGWNEGTVKAYGEVVKSISSMTYDQVMRLR